MKKRARHRYFLLQNLSEFHMPSTCYVNICFWINKIVLMIQSKVTATCFLKLFWIVPFGTINADCWSGFYMLKNFFFSELAFLFDIGTRKHSWFSGRMSPENSVLWKYSATVIFPPYKQAFVDLNNFTGTINLAVKSLYKVQCES